MSEIAFGGRVVLFTSPGGVRSVSGVVLVVLGLDVGTAAAGDVPGAVYLVPGAGWTDEAPATGAVGVVMDVGALVVEPGEVVCVGPMEEPVVHGEGDTAGTGPD